MHKTKLIRTLKMLNAEELEAFGHYVKSPLFNKKKRCIQLLDLLKPAAPTYTSKDIEHDQLFAIMFSDKAHPASLHAVTSLLFNLLKNFLVFLKFQQDDFYKDKTLLDALKERNALQLIEQNLNRLHPQYQITKESSEHYYQWYKLNEFTITFQKTLPKRKNKQQHLDYTPVLEDFYTYNLWTKLKYWAVILNDCISIGLAPKYNQNLLDLSIEEAQQAPWLNNTNIQLWRFLVLLLATDTDNSQYFDKVKTLLKAPDSLNIIKEDMQLIYIIIINYCNRKVLAGQLNYNLERFNLYTQMIEKKLLYIGNYIRARHIKNIVTIGLHARAFDQTLKFIEDYKTEVNPQIQEGVYHFNLGALYFYQKDYDQALEHLIQVDKIDVYYDLDSQALLLKTYYELTDSNALLSFIGSYKNFVKNNKKIPKNRQKAYLNFINLTMNLFKTKALYGKKSPTTLKAKIQKTEPISDKVWLLEKVGELVERNKQ